MHLRDGIKVNFLWRRVHLFDRAAVIIMLERSLAAKQAKVTKVNQKATSKWRPLPLTTVDLQMMGSRYLRMDGKTVMDVWANPSIQWSVAYLTDLQAAEKLYTKGFISYPRTETDQFDKAIDLKKLIEKQLPDNNWGGYAQGYHIFQLLFYSATDVTMLGSSMGTSELLDPVVITIRRIRLSIPFVGSHPRN